jgi:adenylate cyclase
MQTTGNRRLAAIMFTDIVGFTALAQTNESDALSVLDRHNRMLRPYFARFHGREVKTMGDSFLVEFGNALEATNCAVEIQLHLREELRTSAARDRIQIRIGVHLGDVVDSNGDLFGDAVNIASRIEPLAEPGGICVSGPVYDQVQNKVELRFERIDSPGLKNVQMPIPVYRIVLAPVPPPAGSVPPPVDAPRRLAVLPFTNMSPDPQDEFFADGLTDEIITELSRIPSLRVIARTSVMRYKAVSKPVREIGTELRVGYVLEGSVRKAGNRIRITAQLIEAATEEHLWADRFDRELADVFAVQDDIAASVAGALDLRLRPALPAVRAAPATVEAYILYLRGRFLWNQRTVQGVQEAIRRFQEAIALDPEFPLAYAGLADSYSVLVDRGVLDERDTVPKAREAAGRALELDPKLAEAHASMGLALANTSDIEGAEREMREAIALNPGYAIAHHWLHVILLGDGRAEEAGAEIRKAEELDPLSPVVLNSMALVDYQAGQTEMALGKLQRALELLPSSDYATFNLSSLLAVEGRTQEARALLKAYEEGPAPRASKLWVGACGYGLLGDRTEVERRVEQLRALPEAERLSERWFGFIDAISGDLDQAFAILGNKERPLVGSIRTTIRVSPALAKFRADPRFEPLINGWRSAQERSPDAP